MTTNIMVCEDESIFAIDLSDRLTKMGHNVVGIASNGQDAIALARKKKPDLVLMDMRLIGEMSGTDIAEVLKTELQIPVIYLTAYADEATLAKARPTNPLGYLVKPVHDRELRMTIEFGMAMYRLQASLRTEVNEYKKLVDSTQINEIDGTEGNSIASLAGKMDELHDFVGGFAHHFNNSLTATIGYLDWLKECGTVQSFEMRFVKRALESCERQRSIVKNLMWATRQNTFTWEVVSMKDVMLETFQGLSEKKNVNAEFLFTCPAKGRSITADREAIQQAIKAVLINAAEAGGEAGPVSVQLSRVHFEGPQIQNPDAGPGWYVVLSVQDLGSGIPEEIQEAVFDPFFTTSENLQSTGMGLPVAYGVVKAHGGWVEMASQSGEGTTIKLVLPEVSSRTKNAILTTESDLEDLVEVHTVKVANNTTGDAAPISNRDDPRFHGLL